MLTTNIEESYQKLTTSTREGKPKLVLKVDLINCLFASSKVLKNNKNELKKTDNILYLNEG